MSRISLAALPVAALVCVLHVAPACAQSPVATSPAASRPSLLGDRHRYIDDFKQFITGPADWEGRDWAKLGVLLGATAVAYQYDYDVREHFRPEPQPKDYHDVEDAIAPGLVVGTTWFLARRMNDSARFEEATNMVRAAALSSVTTLVFKLGLSRERPDEGVERDEWFEWGGRSMPSGHTALGFSIGTVLAESGTPKRRWVRRVLGYGLGVGTAWLRLEHDSHWFSDIIPGAAIGIAAARFTMQNDLSSRSAEFVIAPMEGGAMLSFSRPLRR